jgi:hypothetical protein
MCAVAVVCRCVSFCALCEWVSSSRSRSLHTTRAYIHADTHARMHPCTHVRMIAYTHMHVHARAHILVHAHAHILTRVQPDVLVSEDDDAPSQSDSVCMCHSHCVFVGVSVCYLSACMSYQFMDLCAQTPPPPLTFLSLSLVPISLLLPRTPQLCLPRLWKRTESIIRLNMRVVRDADEG